MSNGSAGEQASFAGAAKLALKPVSVCISCAT
jgi:hypothetical protein